MTIGSPGRQRAMKPAPWRPSSWPKSASGRGSRATSKQSAVARLSNETGNASECGSGLRSCGAMKPRSKRRISPPARSAGDPRRERSPPRRTTGRSGHRNRLRSRRTPVCDRAGSALCRRPVSASRRRLVPAPRRRLVAAFCRRSIAASCRRLRSRPAASRRLLVRPIHRRRLEGAPPARARARGFGERLFAGRRFRAPRARRPTSFGHRTIRRSDRRPVRTRGGCAS